MPQRREPKPPAIKQQQFLASVFFRCANPLFIGEYRRSGVVSVLGRQGGRERMATVDEIGQEKQRISERLARLDAERTKLADQLNELEIAERVLSRFGGKAPPPAERRRRGRPAVTTPVTSGQRRARGGPQEPVVVTT